MISTGSVLASGLLPAALCTGSAACETIYKEVPTLAVRSLDTAAFFGGLPHQMRSSSLGNNESCTRASRHDMTPKEAARDGTTQRVVGPAQTDAGCEKSKCRNGRAFRLYSNADLLMAHPRIRRHTHVYMPRTKASERQQIVLNTEAPILFLQSAIGSTDGADSPGRRKILPTESCPSHTTK